jgi:hypothetical protein
MCRDAFASYALIGVAKTRVLDYQTVAALRHAIQYPNSE